MGTARSVSFTISSYLMMLAGLGGLLSVILIAADRFRAPDASIIMIFICILVVGAASILNLLTGINGVMNSNRRTNSEVIIRLPKISITLIAIGWFVASINGIMIWHAVLLVIVGVIIPIFFIFSAIKKSN